MAVKGQADGIRDLEWKSYADCALLRQVAHWGSPTPCCSMEQAEESWRRRLWGLGEEDKEFAEGCVGAGHALKLPVYSYGKP